MASPRLRTRRMRLHAWCAEPPSASRVELLRDGVLSRDAHAQLLETSAHAFRHTFGTGQSHAKCRSTWCRRFSDTRRCKPPRSTCARSSSACSNLPPPITPTKKASEEWRSIVTVVGDLDGYNRNRPTHPSQKNESSTSTTSVRYPLS